MTIPSFKPEDCTHSALRHADSESNASCALGQLFSQHDNVHRRASQPQKEQQLTQDHEHRWCQPWNSPTPPQQNGLFGAEDDYEQKYFVQFEEALQAYPSRTVPGSPSSSQEMYYDQNVHVEQHMNLVSPALNTQITDPRQLSCHRSSQQSSGSRVGLPPVIGIDLTTAEAESRLRRAHNLPAGFKLNLSSISDPPPPEIHQDTLVQIAIWSSPAKRLIAADIYMAIQNRFRSFPEGSDQPWRRSIRHMLSFKRAYVKSNDRDHAGRHFWELDFDHLDQGYKRERKRGTAGGLKKRLGGRARHSKLELEQPALEVEREPEPRFDEILEDHFKEEHHSPSPSRMYQDEPPPPSSPENDPPSASAEQSRYAGFGRSPDTSTSRRPTALRAQPQLSHSILAAGGPVYLYPPGIIPDTKPIHLHGFMEPLFTY